LATEESHECADLETRFPLLEPEGGIPLNESIIVKSSVDESLLPPVGQKRDLMLRSAKPLNYFRRRPPTPTDPKPNFRIRVNEYRKH
jgi:hypothetical protein